MKLANIPQPCLLYTVHNYALEHNYLPVEIVAAEQFPNLSLAIQSCFQMARERGAVEFCVHEIRQHYDLQSEAGHWKISIIAFLPKPKN